jgi:hypothetical protein
LTEENRRLKLCLDNTEHQRAELYKSIAETARVLYFYIRILPHFKGGGTILGKLTAPRQDQGANANSERCRRVLPESVAPSDEFTHFFKAPVSQKTPSLLNQVAL